MCLAEFKGFVQLYCLCRRVRIRNFVFPALVTAFSPRALLGFGVFKLRRVLVRKVPTKTATKQRTKQAVNVTIQGNDTEPVTSKSTKSCLVKTTRVRKNKKRFKEKGISTKAVTNSVRFPVPFIRNNQTRTEGRATRCHAFRTIGQVAAGMTKSLRTLYFDFQNKDENNYKPEKKK